MDNNQSVAQAGGWTLPETLDAARSELNKRLYWNEHGLQMVVSILQAYPELARERFAFGMVRVKRYVIVRDAHLLPLSIVMLSPVVNLETIQAMYELYPGAVSDTSSPEGRNILPLSLACMNGQAATKEIIGFLVDRYPNARNVHVHVRPIGALFATYYVRPHSATLPFHFYVRSFIDSHDLSDDDFEKAHKEVCDLLWDEAFESDADSLQYLFWVAASYNCQSLLKYLIEKIPQDFNSLCHSISVQIINTETAIGTASVIPLLNLVDVNVSTDDLETFWNALQILEGNTKKLRTVLMKFPVAMPDETRDDILRSFQNTISESRSLKKLRLYSSVGDPLRPCQYRDVLLPALGVNASLEKMSLHQSIIIDLDCFFDLLQNGPKEWWAEALVVTAAGDTEAQTLPSANVRLPLRTVSRLEELRFVPARIDQPTLAALFDKLSAFPLLRSLAVDLKLMERDMTRDLDATDSIVSLLDHRNLEALKLLRMEVDIMSLCEHLKYNKGLLKLELECYGPACHEHVGEVMKSHNTTLESVTFSVDYPAVEPAWGYSAVDYYSLLNKCGRGTVRSREIPLNAFVGLLSGLGGREDVLAYPERKREGEINMIYGLLRVDPSLWVSLGGLDTMVEDDNDDEVMDTMME